MTAELRFEDLEVGQVYQLPALRVDAARVKAFAAEFDPQPQHLDEQAARATLFGELVASGWHTASMTMRLIADGFFSRFGGLALGVGVSDLEWSRPVRPGDEITAVMEVLELRPLRSRPTLGLATIRTTTRNQRQEPVLVMTNKVMLGRRAPAA